MLRIWHHGVYDRPSEKIIELRDLLSLRRRLKKDEHGIRVRIRNTVLAKYFPEQDRFFNTGRGEILSIVKWCPNPAKIADPCRFDNASQVLKLSGYDLCADRSGKRGGCACDIQERKRRASVCFVSGSPDSISDEQIL